MNSSRSQSDNFDVCVVGNIGMDTNVYLPNNDINGSMFTENLDYIGHAGGYSSKGFSALGFKTAFIGAVGRDMYGDYIVSHLENFNINTEGVFLDETGTHRSVNLVFPNGKRYYFYDGKNHMRSKPNLETAKDIIAKSKLIYFNIPNWSRYLLSFAHKLNKIVVTDVQDIPDMDDSYRSDFFKYSDLIFFSDEKTYDAENIIETLFNNYDIKIIISGLGANGCLLGTRNSIRHFPAVELDLPVVDTNGAGDSLACGFSSSYFLENYNYEKSILRGQICARYTCSIKASTDSLIKKSDLNKIFKEKLQQQESLN